VTIVLCFAEAISVYAEPLAFVFTDAAVKLNVRNVQL
jgi:hypothetical protein